MRFVALTLILLLPALAYGQSPTDAIDLKPAMLRDVGIDQKLGASIPLDAVFHDESGQDITLAQCLHGRPIVLTLVYFKCPMLCNEVLNNLLRSFNGLTGTSIGRQFDVLTVSFDPTETPELATAKKATYLREYGRSGASADWHFLTGNQSSIDALTRSMGFRYKWDTRTNQFVHGSGIMILTPQGTVSHYFFGIDYPPNALKQALDDAAAEKATRADDRVVLYCFHYDPLTGRYGLIIDRALKLGGMLTVLALGSFMAVMFHRDIRRRQRVAN